MALLNNFLVGCDPEFAGVTATGNLVNFKDHHLTREGAVGYDHEGWVAEIRPEPAKGIYTLIKRIQTIINEMPKFRGVVKARAGAKYVAPVGSTRGAVTLGGHVHFGLNPYTATRSGMTAEQARRVKALDAFTEYCEQLDILPKDESAQRRLSAYGKLGDVRPKGDAFNPRFEYRTMASWLFDPRVAMVCLTGAKLAAFDPSGAIESLKPAEASFAKLLKWFGEYKEDINATRVLERLGKHIKIQPDIDLREKWKTISF